MIHFSKSQVKISFYFVVFLLSNLVYAQNPLIKKWDKRFGGISFDDMWAAPIQTSDGGYLIGGSSQSGISGDKTQSSWGSSDFWIVKIDTLGNKQWDKRFGGISGDGIECMQQTFDEGYILGGGSNSGVSGDKTQPSRGGGDYWIVKINSIGIKQWDKRFGTSQHEAISSLQQTKDGGYILGGYTSGGVSGDKTQPSWGDWDYWVVKTDSLGNKQWDRRFGGTGADKFYSVLQTIDGGYLLGGGSSSDSSGDVSIKNIGGGYWVIKIDSIGNKQWDKMYGGNGADEFGSMNQTADGGFILGGYSTSDSIDDKSQNTQDTSAIYRGDYWIVKIDSAGNKQWDKDFGGLYVEDRFGSVVQTYDSGYLLSGSSWSGQGGDKSDNNLGQVETWVVKTDSLGIKQWDKTLFTTLGLSYTWPGFAIQTNDGCYVMSNITKSGIGGDKSQPNWHSSNGTTDFWIIKFCDTTSTIGINDLQLPVLNLQLFPNPANSYCSIYSPSAKNAIISVFDMCGRIIVQQSFDGQSYLNTVELLPGIYIIEVKEKNGRKGIAKLVKQ